MITTVTLSPMLDKTVMVDAVRRGAVSRASRVDMVVGGKGINVSRQLHMLGDETVATGFVGGEVGALLERLLDGEGIRHEFVRVAGMTREGVTYRENDGTSTSVFEPSPSVTADDVDRLLERCRLLAHRSSWVVCGGSSPSPEADDAFRMIISACRERNVPVVLDSYGPALARGVEAGPTMIKPNREEFEQSFGRPLKTEADMVAAARDMVKKGIGMCVITDGARPFVAATRDESWVVTPPRITPVNPTGSGDSMIAGFLHCMLAGRPFDEALTFGAAAGVLNSADWRVASSTFDEIAGMSQKVTVRRL